MIETRSLVGTALLSDGTPSRGSILINPTEEIMDDVGAPLVSIAPVRILFNPDGTFSHEVVPSDINPDRPVPYYIQERFGEYRTYYVTIPSGSSTIDLFRDLSPLGDPPEIPTAYVTQPALQAVIDDVNTQIEQIVSQGTPDATADIKGVIRLTNELAGTADLPELADPAINLSVLFDNSLI